MGLPFFVPGGLLVNSRQNVDTVRSGDMWRATLGIEQLLVDPSSAADLKCSICMDVLNKPKQCQNGHIFCNDCIVDSIKLKPECPICKVPLTAALLGR
jgi:hypothetical protein